MNTLEFEYVLAIVNEGSFSAAAKKLCISQPALSSYVGRIESNIGAQIFDRSVSPIRTTKIGDAYIEYAKKMILQFNDFKKYVADMNDMRKGRIVIGSTPCFTSCYLPDTVSSFIKKHPGIEIEIVDGRIPDIAQMAVDGDVDIFITPPGTDDRIFDVRDVFDENVYLAVPENWEINDSLREFAVSHKNIINRSDNGSPIELSGFDGMPFILLADDQHIHKIAERAFTRYNITPNTVMHVSQMVTSFAFTLAGAGASLITETAIRYGNFAKYPVLYNIDPSIAQRKISIAYRKNRYQPKCLYEFIDELANSLRGINK